jgi:hypothetical protein
MVMPGVQVGIAVRLASQGRSADSRAGLPEADVMPNAHDTAVQMIDTSIVRVPQHGALYRSEQKTVNGPVTRRVDQQDSCGRRYRDSSVRSWI